MPEFDEINKTKMNEEKIEKKPKKRNLIWKGLKVGIPALIFMGSCSSLYTLDQTKQAVITQFGKPVKIIVNPLKDKKDLTNKLQYEKEGIKIDESGPGLKIKIPFVQDVKEYDRRLLRWNGYPEEIPTKDKKYVWVDTTARWYIKDPLKFLRTVGTEEQAQARLDDIIDSVTRNAITKRNLIEIVRTSNREMQTTEQELKGTLDVGKVYEGRLKVVQEITNASIEACKEYGIGIDSEGILIKGLTYVESVKSKVENRMISERNRISSRYISEGNGEYERIMGNKDRENKNITSTAYKEAKEIEGKADAQAVKIYADAFDKDPEFYKFTRTLKLYEDSLGGEKTKLIIGTDNPLYELIKGDISGKRK